MDLLEVDNGILLHRQQEILIFLVLHEEVLGVPAGNFIPQRHRFGNGEDGGMIFGVVGYAETIEKGEKILASLGLVFGHRHSIRQERSRLHCLLTSASCAWQSS